MADRESKVSRKVFPLSKLAASLSAQIAKSYSGTYWITAEISKLNHYPQSGHCYPQLVEKQGGKIVAEIRAFLLKARYLELNSRFREIAGKDLSDGMQILFSCRVSYHPIYGLSLNILDIEPTYTLGEMSRMRTEAIRKLREAGMFELNKKLHSPLLLRRIAVISVETSKGWQDFHNIIASSPFGKAIHIELFPALLQGDAAVERISDALVKIAALHRQFDVACIIRGGGGETGLDCYDNFHLAKAVCQHPLPIITGIGHASNLTVVEQVAHRCFITPSALARYIVEGFEYFDKRLEAAGRALLYLRRSSLAAKQMQLSRLNEQLIHAARQIQDRRKQYLERQGNQFAQAADAALESSRGQLIYTIPSRLRQATMGRLRHENLRISSGPAQVSRMSRLRMRREEEALLLCDTRVRLLDPVHVLKRGFSITFVNGQTVTDAKGVHPGEEIETRLANGSIRSTVNESKA